MDMLTLKVKTGLPACQRLYDEEGGLARDHRGIRLMFYAGLKRLAF